MKLGFFGNTNNYPLMLAQALRELGHEVVLVVSSREKLHRPESRNPEYKKGYPTWIVDASNFDEWDFIRLNPALSPVFDELANCDGLILNDLGPSLLPLLCRPAIALLTGSDISYNADLRSVTTRTACWAASYRSSAEGRLNESLIREFIQRQRKGIQKAIGVIHFPRGVVPESDTIFDELGVTDSKRFFQYIAELQLIKPTPAPQNIPIRVFSATRLTWKFPMEPGHSLLDYKGSDIMIRGLGLFCRQTGVRLDIQLVKKGLHLAETEQLIAEESLTEQVTWSEEMSLASVWSEFTRCDIVIEQLASSAIGMAGIDAFAAGRPVIGNARSEMFKSSFRQPMPICQASTAKEVCSQLQRLVFDYGTRSKLGELGRQFVEEHCSAKQFAQAILQRLQNS
jgi:hypothetical protein